MIFRNILNYKEPRRNHEKKPGKKSQGVQEKNYGGARILKGVHKKNIGALGNLAPPG